jgi:hypothetical protein
MKMKFNNFDIILVSTMNSQENLQKKKKEKRNFK